MAAVMFYIQFLLCSYVGGVTLVEQQILEAMAEKFLSADTDFIETKKNAEFFPFTNAMEFNRKSGRADYNVIKRDNFGRDTSSYLNTWRGFTQMSETEIGRDVRVLFNETSSMPPGFPSESMKREEIENLPLAWQYLLPHIFYDGLEAGRRSLGRDC